MIDATRRGFLVFASAGTAAAVGAVAVPKVLDEHPAAQLDQIDLAHAESFVVHVKDVRKGELAILVGEREVVVTDRELAARLAGLKTV